MLESLEVTIDSTQERGMRTFVLSLQIILLINLEIPTIKFTNH